MKRNTEIQRAQAEARANNEKRFEVSTPCKHGHRAPRLTSTTACTECVKLQQRRWMEENREEYNKFAREYRAKNRDHMRKYIREYMAKYRQTEEGREKVRAAARRHEKKVREQNKQETNNA